MRSGSNVAHLPFNAPKDGDGEDGGATPVQVIIDAVENGYVLTVEGEHGLVKVFLFNSPGEDGPKGLIQTVIEHLGLRDKVKLEK